MDIENLKERVKNAEDYAISNLVVSTRELRQLLDTLYLASQASPLGDRDSSVKGQCKRCGNYTDTVNTSFCSDCGEEHMNLPAPLEDIPSEDWIHNAYKEYMEKVSSSNLSTVNNHYSMFREAIDQSQPKAGNSIGQRGHAITIHRYDMTIPPEDTRDLYINGEKVWPTAQPLAVDTSVDWKRVRDLYARRDTITSGEFMKTIQRYFSLTRHKVIDECIQSLKFGDKSAWLKSELNGRDYCISYLEGLKNPLLDNK